MGIFKGRIGILPLNRTLTGTGRQCELVSHRRNITRKEVCTESAKLLYIRTVQKDFPAMKILIAGGSGFIGKHLTTFLRQHNHAVTVLTRSENKAKKETNSILWDGKTLTSKLEVDAIINLCGQNIAAKRWSPKRKQTLLDSRIQPTKALVNFIDKYPADTKPRLINASAIGFYSSSEEEQTENQHADTSDKLFAHQLVSKWESCAQAAKEYGAMVSCLRFGVVLGPDGGIVKKMSLPFQLGLGAVMGEKSYYMSWVHIDDLCHAISSILTLEKPQLVYNITSPHPCSQLAFSQAFAAACHRPCFLNFPSFLIKKIFGQMGDELLLANQKIIPQELQKLNFKFNYSAIENALDNIASNK